jgi:hypothetical protein
VNYRHGRSTRIVGAAVTPWLIRWVLLRDAHHYGQAPGDDEVTWIHVVCPVRSCHNDGWVTFYEETTVKQCGQHDGPRIPMEPCRSCRRKPGYHRR